MIGKMCVRTCKWKPCLNWQLYKSSNYWPASTWKLSSGFLNHFFLESKKGWKTPNFTVWRPALANLLLLRSIFLVFTSWTKVLKHRLKNNQIPPTQPPDIILKFFVKLDNRNIWITYFYLSGIQMLGIQMVVWNLDPMQLLVRYCNDALWIAE